MKRIARILSLAFFVFMEWGVPIGGVCALVWLIVFIFGCAQQSRMKLTPGTVDLSAQDENVTITIENPAPDPIAITITAPASTAPAGAPR